jgi:hypothetical protein
MLREGDPRLLPLSKDEDKQRAFIEFWSREILRRHGVALFPKFIYGRSVRSHIEHFGYELNSLLADHPPIRDFLESKRIEKRAEHVVPSSLQSKKFMREHYTSEEIAADQQNQMDQVLWSPVLQLFNRVRSAMFRRMTPDDLPRLRSKYMERWLTPEDVHAIATQEADSTGELINKVRNKLRRGVFVALPDEHQGGTKPFFEDMRKNLGMKAEPTMPQYMGYLLESGKEILAWLTWWQPPERPSEEYNRFVEDYLLHGTTGGRIEYTKSGSRARNTLRGNPRRLLLFDTLQGGPRFAGPRIMAKAVEVMSVLNPDLYAMELYRLSSLVIRQRGTRERPELPIGHNTSSFEFFDARGFSDYGIESNLSNPDQAYLREHQNQSYDVYPIWAHMVGKMRDIRFLCWKLWNEDRIGFGDEADDRAVPLDI